MYERDPWRELISGGRGRPPRILAIALGLWAAGAVIDGIDELSAVLEPLRLTTDVWTGAQPWRLVTYAFVGTGGVSLWTAFQLLCVYWFAMELITWIGVKRARNLVLGGVVASSIAATVVQALSDLVGGPGCGWAPYWMMQGQAVVLAIVMSAFAARARWTTVSHTPLLWGLPIPARWLVPLQLVVAAGGFLSTRDLGGLVGIAVACLWGTRLATRSGR